ncbi:hypothetical protein DAMA08_026880 [Martiniozyma asiatica (nom. inval.)]|nr:hypothetical protein DAMA08_026880 [Martiniozyma asiatica]
MLKRFSRRLLSTQTLDSIKEKKLIRTSPFINGVFLGEGNEIFPVFNPYNQSLLANVTSTTTDDILFAFKNTADAFPEFSRTTARSRASILRNLNDALLSHADDLAKLITLENGKPLADSLGEVKYAASFFEWFSEEATRLNGFIIPSASSEKRIAAYRKPIGPVGILTPWNFPLAMITRKLGAAIAAGCTSVIKPATETPLTALAFAQICKDVGVPSGVVNIVPVSENRVKEVGKQFCESSELRKISFTGSTEVGKILMAQCATKIKKLSMELGGNAPFIVCKDADIEKAVDGLIAAKFRSSGQTCVCVNRIFVEKDIHDEFVSLLIQKLKKSTRLGPGMDPTVSHGPLIHKKALKKVKYLVEDAVSKGSKILLGGNHRVDLGKTFYDLTILDNVNTDMDIYHNEIFGPVASIVTVENIQEAISLANNTDVGLAGYVFSKNYDKCMSISEEMDVGMVGINTGLISEAALPFGGVKQSGFGREGSIFGIDEYTIVKSVVVGM